METLQRTANRGSVSTGYDVDNSCKLEADNTEYLQRTVSSTGNRDVGTVSCWVKRTELGAHMYLFTFGDTDNDTGRTYIKFQNTNTLRVGGGSTLWRETDRLFRDTASWYHIVVAFDTTQSTANDRIKIYINGVQETSFSTTNNPSQNDDLGINFEKQTIGFNSIDNDSPFSGYITEIVGLDGTASDATSFGEFDSDTGIWIPKSVSASGTNGFYLDFEDSSNMGNDKSGGTDFTENNITAADQATDTCTNNFCTWLSDGTLFNAGTDNETFSEGGTKFNTRAGTGWTTAYPTQSFAGGKWYMEVKVHETSATTMYGAMPVTRINSRTYQDLHLGQDVDGSIGIYANNGQIYIGTAGSGGSGGALSAGDIVGIAIDMENYKIYFAVNNTYVESGDPAGNSNGRSIEQEPYVFAVAHFTVSTVEETNFGGYTSMSNTHTNNDGEGRGNFIYAPPSGFLACCSKNLGETGG
tara:strand:+ start:493 stop:1899 length:1407 start_codon:yes stop_codon:yes gene_type:complete